MFASPANTAIHPDNVVPTEQPRPSIPTRRAFDGTNYGRCLRKPMWPVASLLPPNTEGLTRLSPIHLRYDPPKLRCFLGGQPVQQPPNTLLGDRVYLVDGNFRFFPRTLNL